MRQGNDVGTQYRSAIYADGRRRSRPRAERSRESLQRAARRRRGHGQITTEIAAAGPFYYAEDYHQQYLAKNPGGYCGLGGTGVSCPIGSRRRRLSRRGGLPTPARNVVDRRPRPVAPPVEAEGEAALAAGALACESPQIQPVGSGLWLV